MPRGQAAVEMEHLQGTRSSVNKFIELAREEKKIEGISSGDALHAFHTESLKRKLTAKDYTATAQTCVYRVGVVTAARVGEVISKSAAGRQVSVVDKRIGYAEEAVV
jgi:hypothetical protein